MYLLHCRWWCRCSRWYWWLLLSKRKSLMSIMVRLIVFLNFVFLSFAYSLILLLQSGPSLIWKIVCHHTVKSTNSLLGMKGSREIVCNPFSPQGSPFEVCNCWALERVKSTKLLLGVNSTVWNLQTLIYWILMFCCAFEM